MWAGMATSCTQTGVKTTYISVCKGKFIFYTCASLGIVPMNFISHESIKHCTGTIVKLLITMIVVI